jgi:hypothetical protein
VRALVFDDLRFDDLFGFALEGLFALRFEAPLAFTLDDFFAFGLRAGDTKFLVGMVRFFW